MPYVPNTQIVRGMTGAPGPTGATGPTGPAGPQGADFVLTSSPIAGATTFTVNAIPPGLQVGAYVAIDSYTTECEVRKVTNISSLTLTVSALTFAHASGNTVLLITEESLSASVFGAFGTGSDEHAALQQAIYQTCAIGGLWLDGGGSARTYSVTQPLVLVSGSKLRNIVLSAATGGGGFAATEPPNAMLMLSQGSVVSFTASAATDVFTTTPNHGLPGNSGLIFQGASMPGGITAGKLYYARDRTASTFKVSLTSTGPAIDISSDGSGTVFCEVLSLAKCFLEDVYVKGNSVVGLSGLAANLQQPAYLNKFRADDCPAYGMNIGGQQAVFYNTELTGVGLAGIVLGGPGVDSAQFMWFFGTDIEGFNDSIYVDTGGAHSCLFDGVHIEALSSTGSCFHLAHEANMMTFSNVQFSGGSVDQAVLKVDTGFTTKSGYILTSILVSGWSTPGLLMVDDQDRGVAIDAWGDVRNYLNHASAVPSPTSQTYLDPSPNVVVRPDGGKLMYGAQVVTESSLHIQPGTTQSGDQITARDTSGNRISGFNKAGVLFTERNTVPADGDLVAGELTFWLDDTNGACKAMFKAKQADGTVRTGSVNLT